jgi:exodeoxyribonuclease V alpha subunit
MNDHEPGESGVVEGYLDVYYSRPGWFVGELEAIKSGPLGGSGPSARRGYSREEPFKVIGSLSEDEVTAGVMYGGVYAGEYEIDRKRHEPQFRIRGVVDIDLDEKALYAYLSSGLVWHVREATASAIMAAFGTPEADAIPTLGAHLAAGGVADPDEIADAASRARTRAVLTVLVRNPERLAEVSGISAGMLSGIRSSLAATLPQAGIVGLLAPFGLNLGVCRSVWKRFGSGAAATIRANPWRLSMDFSGVSFQAADSIALRLGFSRDAPERMEAAIAHVVSLTVREGHTVSPQDLVLREAAALLGLGGGDEPEWDTDYEALTESSGSEEETGPQASDAGAEDSASAVAALSQPGSADPDQEALDAATNEGMALSGVDEDFSPVAPEVPVAPPPPLPTDPLSGALERLIGLGAMTRTELSGTTGISRADIAEAERTLAETLRGLMAQPATEPATDDEIAALEIKAGLTFDPTQRAALAGSLAAGVTVLTGGPGTGKTTLVRSICDLADARGLSLALMSFTGKASKVLSEATGREATTIHRYLRFVPGQGFTGPDAAARVVIVDEVSMLEVGLAATLARYLRADTQLILVGDVDQLPAIGPGNILGDLVDTPGIPVYRLAIIHRTAASSGIPHLARAINAGETDLEPYFDRSTTRFVAAANAAAVEAWIARHFARYRDRVEEFQVLAPMKKGTAGVTNLNRVIAGIIRDEAALSGRALERDAYDLRAGDRIIWSQNDKDLGLFNGQIGTLREVLPGRAALVEFEGTSYRVPSEKVGNFELAYALTVHRYQGSQQRTVIVVMDGSLAHGQALHLYSRRLFYTAVTRARSTVAIVGQSRVVREAVSRHEDTRRRTMLPALLTTS